MMAQDVRMSKKNSKTALTSFSRMTLPAPRLIDHTKACNYNYHTIDNTVLQSAEQRGTFFTLDLITCKDVFSIDRLQAAHLFSADRS